MDEIQGHGHVKRVLEVAAAGRHNMLMVGPPGAGKTLTACAGRHPAQLTIEEALDFTRIHLLADALPPGQPLIRCYLFADLHYIVSATPGW